MLDLQERRDTLQVATPADMDVDERVETFELMDRPAEKGIAYLPIAHAFAFLAGGALTTLGIAGFLPFITANGTLLGFFQVSTSTNIIHLVTGLAGLAAWRSRRESLAVWWAVAMAGIYTWIFSDGNLAFGNAADTAGAPTLTLLAVLPLRDLPLLLANALHVTLGLVSLIVAGTAMLQQGARATARQQARRIREYRSHVTIRPRSTVA